MTATAAVWWTSLAAFVVVLVLIVVQIIRIVRALGRIERRVSGYADLPVVAAIVRAEAASARLEAAAAQIETLTLRAQTAIEAIRRGPLPREVVVAYARVRAEIAAFRAMTSPRRRG